MRQLAILVLMAAASTVSGQPLSSKSATPPVAKKIPKITTLHGEKLVDDYFWLREKKNPEVLAHLKAENAYAEAVMEPTAKLQETLYQDMLSRIKQTDLSLPYQKGDYWYYSKTEEGKQYPVHCRKKGSVDGKEAILLDLNLLAKGKPFLGLGAFEVSDDGNLLAYALDVSGFRDYTLYVKDLRTGELLPDRIAKVQGVRWAGDNRTLFFVTEDHAKRPFRIHRQRLGDAKDEVIFEEKDELYRVSLSSSKDRAYLFLSSESMTTSEVRAIPSMSPANKPRILMPREDGHEYQAEHRNDEFVFLTNKGAKNRRVVLAPVAQPTRWRELVPHDKKTAITGMELFETKLVLSERVDGLPGFRVVDWKTGKGHALALPERVCEVAAEENAEYRTTRFRYHFESFVTPRTIYEYDLATHAVTELKKQEVPNFDPSKYSVERIEASAADGVRIPITLVRQKNAKRDGASPLLLYGYGAYGYAMPISFQSNRFSLIDRGVIFAIAHIRGGGEFGPLWHDQGKMLVKKNSFTDFIACADHLVKEKYTRRDRLAIQGRSAGGLLMGGVLTFRPDVAKAAVVEVPFLEAINSMLDLDMPLVVQEFLEWGDPRKKAEYAAMKAYCPYTNLKAQAYPAMLLTSYFNDSQVMYWEPVKYTAKLRTLRTDDRPLLLKTNLTGGHGGASGRYDALREQAFVYAFVLSQIAVSDGLSRRDGR